MPLIDNQYLLNLLPLDEILEHLQESLSTRAKFGPNLNLESLDKGYSCYDLAIFYPNWIGFEESEKLPEKLLIKACRRKELMLDDGFGGKIELDEKRIERRNKKFIKTHIIESRVLKLLGSDTNFMVPKIHGHNVIDEDSSLGYIIMEYIEYAKCIDIYHLPPQNLIIDTLHWIAKLQMFGISEKINKEHRDLFTVPEAGWVSNIHIERLKPNIDNVYEGMLGPEKNGLILKAREAIMQLVDGHEEIVHKVNDDLGLQPVLCHSDLYSRNMMVDDNYNLKAVIDFQGVRYGNCAEDVMFLLYDVLPGKDRRIFVNHYFAEFYKILVYRYGGDPPYSFKDLRESLYRLSELACLFLTVCHWHEREKTMENVDDMPKETAKFVLDDKFEALLEDFIFYHERNKRIFKF